MAQEKGGAGGPLEGRRRSLFGGGAGAALSDSWLAKNWQTLLVLGMIVLLAFFIRSYFVYGASVDNGNLFSGGSDSYYHQRVIDYITATGDHLIHDPALNYPSGMRNPRLPLYDWSCAVTGMIGSALTGTPVEAATSYVLVVSAAFWGALTVVPVYLIGRIAFGNRAGIAAAFLLALSAGNIQRSVLSDADHDAMVLFFAMFGFYFFLMSLRSIKGDRWVQSYRGLGSIKSGLVGYARQNQVSIAYAGLAGVSLAAVAFIWEGFMYLLIIMLVYFLVQLFVNRFKDIDSFGVLVTIAISLGLLFLLAGPMYKQLDLVGTWYDMPLLLTLGMLVIGIIFVVTRDYPWTLVVPTFIILVIGALIVLDIFAPNLFEAIITGQGYLVKSKLYSTIGEAQAPDFSTLALSFGAVTFWLSFVGLVWAAYKILRNVSAYFIFLVVWIGAALYMATSASRFLFNASPAFAIGAGWVLVMIIKMVRFEDLPKGLAGLRLRNPLPTLRKGVKVRHILGVLFLSFLIILPNAWNAVDAAIPYDQKASYDLQIYNNLPQILRPASYDSINGSDWYLGSFSYSLPYPQDYYPAAWSWFAQRDSNIQPLSARPAFLSWWDYGFEAIDAGKHPTVADDFQNGYNFAGCFITCTNETQAVAMFVTRTLEAVWSTSEGPAVRALLAEKGVDVAKINDILTNPSSYISVVMANPDIYGVYDMDNSGPSAQNAKYIAARVELSKVGMDDLVDIYSNLQSMTGVNIGYFAVDTRLFPFSVQAGSVFYAPAKLSDRRIDPASNAPIDFYEIKAVDNLGNLIDLANVTSTTQVVNYEIIYKPLFYQTMLYRAFMGFGPDDLGLTDQGLPGLSGSLASYQPMQGWNMSHFRLVYKTAYYNPFPADLVQNHTDAWIAVSSDEAASLQAQIDAGTITGVVDASASTLLRGTVFLQYYDGAIIQGHATTSSGAPYPNAYVTVLDEYGIPHMSVKTDANGYYSVVAPFGNVTLVYSVGTQDKRTLIANELQRTTLTVSMDQAMRRTNDYVINGDIVLQSTSLSGQVFWHLSSNNVFTPGTDQPIAGATVVFENSTQGFSMEATTAADGTYTFTGIPPLSGYVYAVIAGHSTTPQAVTVTPLQGITQDISISPAEIRGTVVNAAGEPATGFKIMLLDEQNGNETAMNVASNGSFDFPRLLPGTYSLGSGVSGLTLGNQEFLLAQGQTVSRTFTAYDSTTITGVVTTPTGMLATNVSVALLSDSLTLYTQTDASGRYGFTVPVSDYSIYTMAIINDKGYAALLHVSGTAGTVTVNPTLSSAYYLSGTATGQGVQSGTPVRLQSRTTLGVLSVIANDTGFFRALLPTDSYFVYIATSSAAYWNDVFVSQDAAMTFALTTTATISGTVWYDSSGNGVMGSSEGLANVTLVVQDIDGRTITDLTSSTGAYSFSLLPGLSYTLSVSPAGYAPQQFTYAPLTSSVANDIQMQAFNRSVNGAVSFQGSSLVGMVVDFDATSGTAAISATVTTDATGRFGLSLHPGTYQVSIVQNVSAGSNATQYQYTATLVVSVGQDPTFQSISVLRRVLVTGSISPTRTFSATISFSGPDSVQITATTNFSVYLQEGLYNLYVDQERFAARFANITQFTVSQTSNTLNIVTDQAFTLTGTIYYNSARFPNLATVTYTKSTGGSYSLSSTAVGTFNVVLPTGSYNVSIDSRLLQTVSGEQRYLRYTGWTPISFTANQNIRVDASRALDNTTVVGQVTMGGTPVGATFKLFALDATAINTTATSTPSGFDLSVAPGNYSVYVTEIGGQGVYLGSLSFAPYVTNYANFTLVPGLALTGLTTVNGVGAPAFVEIRSADYVSLNSGADGSFFIYLPAGAYQVNATASGAERGIAVTYLAGKELNLSSSQSISLSLAKAAKAGVDVSWDSSEKLTVNGGDTVVYNVKVTNTGNVAETFKLTTVSAGSGWSASVSPSTVTLDFGQANFQLVTVTIVTPTDAKVSHSSPSVRATGITYTSATDSVSLDVGIATQRAVAISYTSPMAVNGTTFSYTMSLGNTGNADDTFAVNVINPADLLAQGWRADMRVGSGSYSSSLSEFVSAGTSQSFELRLTPTRTNPDPSVTVMLGATSQIDANATTSFAFVPQLPQFTIPSGGLSVTGPQVAQTLPSMPISTIVLIGLVVAMITVMLVVSVQKGVFRRGRR